MADRQYTVLIRKDGPHYVALCLELNVATQGESLEELRANMSDAIQEFLAYMHEQGALQDIRPVPFDVLREFLLDGIDEDHQNHLEVLALAA